MSRWFEADKVGLRQIAERLVERRGFGMIGAELYQNVMDTNATVCEIVLEKTKTRGWYTFRPPDMAPLCGERLLGGDGEAKAKVAARVVGGFGVQCLAYFRHGFRAMRR